MALPGTPGQRISNLCNGRHIPQMEYINECMQ